MEVLLQHVEELVVPTSRFGDLVISEEQIIDIPDGLLGFENVTEYCLFRHAPESPFFWLQAITDPELAFVVINPFDFFPEYEFDITDADTDYLKLATASDAAVWVLISFSDNDITANLVGPLVINVQANTGKQIILACSQYSTRHPLNLLPSN